MAERVRDHDWQSTPLGPASGWPVSLRTTVQVMLASSHPMYLAWGPEFIQIYNDAYSVMLGDKHPGALGGTAPETFPEAWEVVRPWFDAVLERGDAVWHEDAAVPLQRSGFLEQCYFTFSYSPVLVGDEVGGLLAVVVETSARVVGERRMSTLTELASRTGRARSGREVCDRAMEVLEGNPEDFPFALLYLRDSADGDSGDGSLELAGSAGLEPGHPAAPARIGSTESGVWPVHEIRETGKPSVVGSLPERFGDLPGGPWPEPVPSAVLLPVGSDAGDAGAPTRAAGVLVAGVSPRRPLDQKCRSFLELTASNIGTALSSARAYEQEHERVERLEELSRAKNAFFSDMTHEFRTPLTLLLGPLEELISGAEDFRPETRERFALMHRNAMRLKKLVGDLLDFSRLEGGSMDVSFQPVDLALFTEELASFFRSAVERAGLELRIEVEPLDETVYVDADSWEKILFNLLSNALKFTREGAIEVSVRRDGDAALVSVSDTGPGIPEDELPKLFERFHRVRAEREGNPEGSGIGLALTRDLVELHGGTVGVESEPGVGSTFTVSLPFGRTHLPAEGVVEEPVEAAALSRSSPRLVEARGWAAERAGVEAEAGASSEAPAATKEGSILLAEDNSDLRRYIARVLSDRYEVRTVTNGELALEAIEERRPDLVLADVMMPEMDGFDLLRVLREREGARLPIILVSALEEEAVRVEALEAGADDYLVKPFSARELRARIGAHLGTARDALRRERELRAEAEARRDEAEAARRALQERDRRKNEFLAMLSHELRSPLAALATSLEIASSPGVTPKEVERARDRASRQISFLTRQVDGLLEISRITQGKIEFERESVELVALLSSALEDRRSDFEEGRVELDVDLPESGVRLVGDSMRLYQVFDNLLQNAADYTEPGGRVSVRLRRREDPAEALIEVADDGIGMSRSTLERIFEPFSQAAPGRRTKSGLGLGLALSRLLVERHGGTLRATSEGEGEGSTFTVRLSLEEPLPAEDAGAADPEREPARAAAESDGGAALRVLVIEDHEDFAEALRMSLEMSGHCVEVAMDGEQGLERVDGFRPEVVLCDIGLPGDLSGHDVARELTREPKRRPERLIAISGYGQPSDLERSREAGFDEHLTKPVRPSELQRILAERPAPGDS